jgi:hypothetical protein
MAAVLTTPIAVAAIVLAVAGIAKLRSPGGAARALAFALLAPGRATSALLAVAYALLALLAARLASRGAGCGCFGEDETPATATHVWLSVALALVAAAGIASPPHGIAWLLSGSPDVAGPLAFGIAGAVYATVIAYTELPSAWSAWRPR